MPLVCRRLTCRLPNPRPASSVSRYTTFSLSPIASPLLVRCDPSGSHIKSRHPGAMSQGSSAPKHHRQPSSTLSSPQRKGKRQASSSQMSGGVMAPDLVDAPFTDDELFSKPITSTEGIIYASFDEFITRYSSHKSGSTDLATEPSNSPPPAIGGSQRSKKRSSKLKSKSLHSSKFLAREPNTTPKMSKREHDLESSARQIETLLTMSPPNGSQTTVNNSPNTHDNNSNPKPHSSTNEQVELGQHNVKSTASTPQPQRAGSLFASRQNTSSAVEEALAFLTPLNETETTQPEPQLVVEPVAIDKQSSEPPLQLSLESLRINEVPAKPEGVPVLNPSVPVPDMVEDAREVKRYYQNKDGRTVLEKGMKWFQEQKTIFISLDLEWWERNNNLLTEIGLAVYDPSQEVQGKNRFLLPTIHYEHIIIKENLKYVNGRFVADNKYNCSFCESKELSLVESRKMYEGLLRSYEDYAAAKGMQVVYVGHNVDGDLDVLRKLKFYVGNNLQIFDTMHAWKANRSANFFALHKILTFLNIPHALLHNATNDAHYTLVLAMYICDPEYREFKELDEELPSNVNDRFPKKEPTKRKTIKCKDGAQALSMFWHSQGRRESPDH